MIDFEDREFTTNGRKVLITKCPKTLKGFEKIGFSEADVVNKAVTQIVYHSLLSEFRKNPELMELEFKPTIKRAKVIQKIDLNKLSEDQKNTLRQMGII